jgi:hypothetical protein
MFLSGARARKWIEQHHSKYIHHIAESPANASARTYTTIPEFCRQLRDWSAAQQRGLVQLVGQLVGECWTWRRFLMEDDWVFLKSTNTLEAGMPHTIQGAIVLPEWLVEQLLDAQHKGGCRHGEQDLSARRKPLGYDAVETLLHERVHVLQKLYPDRFSALYREWEYQQPTTKQTRVIMSLHRERPFRANPDTPTDWVWRGEWYPFAQLTAPQPPPPLVSSLGSPSTMPTFSLRSCNHQLVHLPTCKWRPIAQDPEYTTFHGTDVHCYHPEETAAVLLAKEMIGDVFRSRSRPPLHQQEQTHTEAAQRLRRWCVRWW